MSLLSIPSKILKSEVNGTIVRHVYKASNLVTDKQWAHRAGISTELLLSDTTYRNVERSCRRRLSAVAKGTLAYQDHSWTGLKVT